MTNTTQPQKQPGTRFSKRALVTGASSGLGVDFARQLAVRGYNLILTARRAARLEQLKAELESAHAGITIDVMPADLTQAGACQALFEKTAARPVDVLIVNAGFGAFGKFLATGRERHRDLIDLNIKALTDLAHLFGADMAKRKAGHILLVGSLAGFQPMPLFATYAASKAYVLSFAEALRIELRPRGVAVAVLSPGYTDTEFMEVAGQSRTGFSKSVVMDSGEVVKAGLEALFARRDGVVPGLANKLVAHGNRLLPRRISAELALWLNKKRG